MACPFFMPLERFEGGAWSHPARLPLGAGWRGLCTARPDSIAPTDEQLQEHCNLGYASRCPHLPAVRDYDAVRFSIARSSDAQITVRFCCEADHRPGEHGDLEFLRNEHRWPVPHPDTRLQRMAECYLESFLRKTNSPDPALSHTIASDPS